MKNFLAVLALAVVAACAQVGVAPPQSLDEGLAYASSQVAALEASAAQAVGAGSLKPAAAQQVLTLGDQANAAIASARASEKAGDVSSAQGKLALASSLLAQLASFLQSQGVK